MWNPFIIPSFLIPILLTAPALADGTLQVLVKLSPAGSFTAKSEKLKGTLIKSASNYNSERLSVGIETFKTGMKLRDEHFWKHLKYPSIQKIQLTSLKATNGKGIGTLEINGVKKEVAMDYKESGNQIEASFKVMAHDFNLPEVKYLGISVRDEINIEAKVEVTQK